MNDERVLEGIVTGFLLNTCRLRPQLSRPAVQAAMCSVEAATKQKHPDDEAEADFIPLTTGSVAEFYIEPMLSHVGDVDVMYHRSTELAIPHVDTRLNQTSRTSSDAPNTRCHATLGCVCMIM